LAISIFAEPVIKVMAARSFYPAARVVPLLTFALVLDRLRTFFDFSFMITDRTKMRGAYQYGTAVVITIAYVGLIPRFGLIGAAVAQCLTFAGTFVYVHILSRRYYDPEINLIPIGLYSLIGLGAYFVADIVSRTPSLGIDLLARSFVMLIAAILIAAVGFRAIGAVDVSMLESLPSPLNKLGRMQFGRISGS
jgi:O-antigen/teichoic acid export membrane protein